MQDLVLEHLTSYKTEAKQEYNVILQCLVTLNYSSVILQISKLVLALLVSPAQLCRCVKIDALKAFVSPCCSSTTWFSPSGCHQVYKLWKKLLHVATRVEVKVLVAGPQGQSTVPWHQPLWHPDLPRLPQNSPLPLG